MRRALAFCCLVSAALSGCAGHDTTGPVNPPAPPGTVLRWSDPVAWPDGTVPTAGAAVTIPADRSVLLDVSPPALKSLTIDGTLELDQQDLTLSSDWILVRGTFRIGSETAPYTHKAVITLTGVKDEDVNGMGDKVLGAVGGALEFHGAHRVSWTRLSASAAAGATEIDVLDPIDWRPGDRIVVASTDFDPLQAEQAVVAGVTGQRVTLTAPLRYSHWGQLQTYAGKTLDERAEVGLLTRQIVIQGDSASLDAGYGGHLMVMQGGVAHIEGVELTRMGQAHELARYPMHWHLEGSVPGQYFRDNAVWETFNRCVTVHGTSDAVVANNVCYENLGHAIFLEDGAETGNTIEGNLGLVTLRPTPANQLLGSDNTPATFWLTNPANTVRNNVAAGSQGFGFWYAFPVSPTGLSTGSPLLPRSTPLGEFTDNVAHSNKNTGLNLDNGPTPDGTTETAHYAPREIPGDNSSPLVTSYFRNFTGYKHSGRAVWLRGTQLRLVNAMLADNHIGATFASSETFLQDAVLVGASANAATPFSRNFPVRGYEFYDGRVGAERVTFVDYTPTANNYMSALGFNRKNGFPVSSGNYADAVTFQNANQVYLEDPQADKDGDKAAVILDGDGSLTGTAGRYVVANNPFLITPGCVRRDAWNAWECSDRFVNIRVRGANGQVVAPLTLRRDDGATGQFVGVPSQPSQVSASVVSGRRYDVTFAGGPPSQPQLYAYGLSASDFVRVSLPCPSASIDVVRDYNSSHPIAPAANLAALDAGSGGYYYDAGSGLLHLKLMAQSGRDWATLFVVPR
jgi:cell surface hyaluronidase